MVLSVPYVLKTFPFFLWVRGGNGLFCMEQNRPLSRISKVSNAEYVGKIKQINGLKLFGRLLQRSHKKTRTPMEYASGVKLVA
ncbi:protein of unknown function [Shewanella benthica]|uniref:Uncharacterized protein n=1 Tax=Shewanella benthica TaxID=43661 RepID=A0A330M4F5_9GAMM|nr:protein of unknown function [Shewanella benthica]